jgi:divalent metal cation (Fe/Co/Zn/Cd) transporter
VEIITVVWMVAEAVAAITAGVIAHSLLLVAFGLDSVIELVTGGVLLWRLMTEARGSSLDRVKQAENRAAWITGIALALLCVYVVVSAGAGLLLHHEAGRSPVGLGLAVGAVIVMPLLAWQKRSIAARIDSAALRADAACSMTCAYMAATLLIGLGLNALFGWWWAEHLASLAFLFWLVAEAREALEGARAGRGGCDCG